MLPGLTALSRLFVLLCWQLMSSLASHGCSFWLPFLLQLLLCLKFTTCHQICVTTKPIYFLKNSNRWVPLFDFMTEKSLQSSCLQQMLSVLWRLLFQSSEYALLIMPGRSSLSRQIIDTYFSLLLCFFLLVYFWPFCAVYFLVVCIQLLHTDTGVLMSSMWLLIVIDLCEMLGFCCSQSSVCCFLLNQIFNSDCLFCCWTSLQW